MMMMFELPPKVRIATDCSETLDRGDPTTARELTAPGSDLTKSTRDAAWIRRFCTSSGSQLATMRLSVAGFVMRVSLGAHPTGHERPEDCWYSTYLFLSYAGGDDPFSFS